MQAACAGCLVQRGVGGGCYKAPEALLCGGTVQRRNRRRAGVPTPAATRRSRDRSSSLTNRYPSSASAPCTSGTFAMAPPTPRARRSPHSMPGPPPPHAPRDGRSQTQRISPPHSSSRTSTSCAAKVPAQRARAGWINILATRIGDTPTCGSHGGDINAAAVQLA